MVERKKKQEKRMLRGLCIRAKWMEMKDVGGNRKLFWKEVVKVNGGKWKDAVE